MNFLLYISFSILRLWASVRRFHNIILWKCLHLSAFALWKLEFQNLQLIFTVINLTLLIS